MPTLSPDVYRDRPVKLLQHLLRFDTSNPPGNEKACIDFIEDVLTEAGLDTQRVARDPERPNLIARLPGRGAAPPLLLYGHVDVVPTTDQRWTHPPFAGRLAGGYVWGRGALDMKGGIAMMVAALRRAQTEAVEPAGDLIFAALSDEEAGGEYGAQFLVEQHPELFEGVRYAIGEFGGFSFHLGGRRFYPIQVAEKRLCRLRITLRGSGGHGALPHRGGAMAKLARALGRLDRTRLPVHLTPTVRRMLTAMAEEVGVPTRWVLRALLRPRLAGRVLDVAGEDIRPFEAMLCNTVNATLVRGGSKINVVPSKVELKLDGRLLPGVKPDDLVREVRGAIGGDGELEILHRSPGAGPPDMEWFDALGAILREADPGSTPVPLLLPGVSDARYFAQLGIQTYGFLPMKLPPDFDFMRAIHAADERIPADAVAFGADAIYEAIRRYGR